MIAARQKPTAGVTDAVLFARIAAGEIGALGELYDRHREAIRRFLSRATANADDVDDLVHATFLTAADSAARYDGRPVSRAWLMGIAVRLLRRRRYSLGRWLAVLSSLGSLRPASADPRAGQEARFDVDRALRRISEAKRITLLLAEVEGLSGPEIAAILDIPIGTVWTRLHTARHELRSFLSEDDE